MQLKEALGSARRALLPIALGVFACDVSHSGGIDHKIDPPQDTGIWSRGHQQALQDLTIATVVGGALWFGSENRTGHTFWQSVDSAVLGAATAAVMKPVFSRARPMQTDDPGDWFQGHGHNSFPSGEVMLVTTAVTPFVLEYGPEHPAVYALELLPLYDGIARVKAQAHWQTDVLASLAIGTGIGWYTHERELPISVKLLPRGITIGLQVWF
jgi:membrane-associated phospholipid phosphatase